MSTDITNFLIELETIRKNKIKEQEMKCPCGCGREVVQVGGKGNGRPRKYATEECYKKINLERSRKKSKSNGVKWWQNQR